tara:strand:+ start:149 stop:691 length:543 start_codon:yes stop_codon:yes gene_type:complete
MTKKLEEEFNLPPIEDISLFGEEAIPIEAGESTIETSKQDIALTQSTLEVTQRIDSALPIVQGLEQLDREMDEYALKAMATFEDLVDLGKNVEDRHAAPIFDSAAKMITAALQAKQAKMDKKMKMIELQMRKAKLDLDTRKVDASLEGKEDAPEEIEGKFIGDRSSMLAEIMNKMKENDK